MYFKAAALPRPHSAVMPSSLSTVSAPAHTSCYHLTSLNLPAASLLFRLGYSFLHRCPGLRCLVRLDSPYYIPIPITLFYSSWFCLWSMPIWFISCGTNVLTSTPCSSSSCFSSHGFVMFLMLDLLRCLLLYFVHCSSISHLYSLACYRITISMFIYLSTSSCETLILVPISIVIFFIPKSFLCCVA